MTRCPNESISIPLATGPKKPEIDAPRASQENAAARWFGSARSPTTCWTDSIAKVEPVPTSAADTSRGATSAVA